MREGSCRLAVRGARDGRAAGDRARRGGTLRRALRIPAHRRRVSDRMLAELLMGGLVRLARTFTGPSAVPAVRVLRARAPGPSPRVHTNLRRRPPVRPEHDVDGLRPRNRGPAADAPASRALRPASSEAQRRLDRMTTEVRRPLACVSTCSPRSLRAFPRYRGGARDLGMSERSLRRHLASGGYVVPRRRPLGARGLGGPPAPGPGPLRSKQAAVALGFADAAAFTNAFKRWTGMTPGEYRRIRGGPVQPVIAARSGPGGRRGA